MIVSVTFTDSLKTKISVGNMNLLYLLALVTFKCMQFTEIHDINHELYREFPDFGNRTIA